MWLAGPSTEKEAAYVAGMFSVGGGSVTVLRNVEIWRNWNIQCHDHAYFLWSLVNKNGRVWFLENRHAPSLFSLALRHLPYTLLALCLLICMIIWSALTRFGPIFSPSTAARRSFAEHIEASANFLWKHCDRSLLLADLRAAIEQSMGRRVVGYEKKSRLEKVDLIAKLTRYEGKGLESAIYKQNIESDQEFIRLVKVLKQIKDSL